MKYVAGQLHKNRISLVIKIFFNFTLIIFCNEWIIIFQFSDNAKWILNVQWQMEGVDIHLDVNVGQQLSALGHTLTMLTGSEEDDIHVPADYDSDDADQPDNSTSQVKKKVWFNYIYFILFWSLLG